MAGRDKAAKPAVDNKSGGGEEAAPKQVVEAGKAGDNDGDKGRTAFQLSDDQLAELATAQAADQAEGGHSHAQAFWLQAAATMGFIAGTAVDTDDEKLGAFVANVKVDDPDAPKGGELGEDVFRERTGGMERAADDVEIGLGSMVGDLRDGMIEVFKHRPRPWSQLSAAEQKDVAVALEYAAKVMVRKAVVAIAADGRSSVRAKFEGFSDKGGDVKGSLKFFDVDEKAVLVLHRASGQEVLLITADSTAYTGERREAPIQRDDPELTFEAGTDDVHQESDADLAEAGEPAAEAPSPADDDALYARAVEAVRDNNEATASFLEKELSIGFDVADKLIDRMEEEGIVGAPDVTTKRRIYPAGQSAHD